MRKEYAPEWRQFYKDAAAAQTSADAASESAISRAHFFVKDGRWTEARDAFADRDSVRDAVAHDIAERKSDLKARQTEDLRERQRDACDALRDIREVQYEQLLQRHRDERAAVRASEAFDGLGVGRELIVEAPEHALPVPAANENRTIEMPAPTPERDDARAAAGADDRQRQDVTPAATSLPEAIVVRDGLSAAEAVPAVTHQVSDLAAGAIGGVASYLADQLGELFAPTPPEVQAAEAKAKAMAERDAEKPVLVEKDNPYDRQIEAALRLIEEERQQQQASRAYWEERDRGKGFERDQ